MPVCSALSVAMERIFWSPILAPLICEEPGRGVSNVSSSVGGTDFLECSGYLGQDGALPSGVPGSPLFWPQVMSWSSPVWGISPSSSDMMEKFSEKFTIWYLNDHFEIIRFVFCRA